jgi:hypothetical protein
MSIIQSFSNFDEYLDDRKVPIESKNISHITWGRFESIGSIMTVLFVLEQCFFFSIENEFFKISDSTTAFVEDVNVQSRLFKLFNDGLVVTEFIYEIDKTLFDIQPFDYLDEEDFDWGMFLCNIINNKDRQRRILVNVS